MKKYIKVSMRPYPCLLLVTSDKRTFSRLYKYHFGEEKKMENNKHGYCSTGNSGAGIRLTIIYAADTPALVHELSHCIAFVFECVGIPIDDRNSETFAYLIEQLFSDARHIFDRKKK
jgi:hypothetical protein